MPVKSGLRSYGGLLEHVTKHLRHLFPELVSYNRFVELEKDVAIPYLIQVKGVAVSLPGKSMSHYPSQLSWGN